MTERPRAALEAGLERINFRRVESFFSLVP